MTYKSRVKVKYNFKRLVFTSTNQNSISFLDELQEIAKDAFGVASKSVIEQFIFSKMPLHLEKLINRAHLENSTYEQIVIYLERELEINSLKTSDELLMNTVIEHATKFNSEKHKPTCQNCKTPDHYKIH